MSDYPDVGGGGAVADPEISSAEIRQLLRRLDPQIPGGGHKDRVRRLARFRNYVTGDKYPTASGQRRTPEFYDDDLPLLFLGSLATPLVDDEDVVAGANFYGLLQACGAPSAEHENTLKRSARHAMALLKYLVCDFIEYQNGQPVKISPHRLNPFAHAFCCLTPQQLELMHLDLHIEGDKRGGAKEDACHIVVLLVTRHIGEDGETTSPLPLEDLLLSPQARQAFLKWLQQNAPRPVQERMATAMETAKAKKPKPKMIKEEIKQVVKEPEVDDDDDLEEDEHPSGQTDGQRKKSSMTKENSGPAVRWEDTEVYRLQEDQMAQSRGGVHETVRDSQQAAQERERALEEKLRLQGKDPLGIRDDKDLDLRQIQELKVDLLEQALKDLEDEIREEELNRDRVIHQMDKADKEDVAQHLRNLEAQKESLEAILDSVSLAIKDETSSGRSILPTDPNYDPLLFLTLVHRSASYEVLRDSIARLSNKTSTQLNQLQNLVRDNFALFVRCADRIDIFDVEGRRGPDVMDRLDKLDALAESCSHQAKRSFKPLLDNTNEVRKVQSALAVLQRVGPILQTPQVMRQHLENGRISEALEAYRQVKKFIDEQCNIALFNNVKDKAAEAAREAKRDLEKRLAQPKASLNSLLEGIRDLRELLELDIPADPNEAEAVALSMAKAAATNADESKRDEPFYEPPIQSLTVGVFKIGDASVNVREHPPALACLLLQAAHFNLMVERTIELAQEHANRIYEGESLAMIQAGDGAAERTGAAEMRPASEEASVSTGASSKPKNSGNQWKYDVLDSRVISTIRAVDLTRIWLPRLLHIGMAAREDEKRRAARVGRRRASNAVVGIIPEDNQFTAFEVFLTNISPAVSRLVEHAAFCALGSSNRSSGKDVKMTFGKDAPDKLRMLLRSPLPPTQSTKCAKELAELVKTVIESSSTAGGLRPNEKEFDFKMSPLDECRILAEEAVITVERRKCIFAFDVCARTCSSRASGSGKFDGDALLKCLHTLSEELSRAEECASEVEKGCELVVRRCCEGLASYVRDRGDSARLRAVAECADALTGSLQEVVREVEFLGCNAAAVEEVMEEDVLGLEGAMFDEFLDNVRHNVANCCRIGWLDMDEGSMSPKDGKDISTPSMFPAYLSASLLAIVRCRAQVERALGDKVRRSEATSYQYLAMATAADGVAEGICNEIKVRKTKMKVRQADRMANELQFLMNTLKNYLSDETLSMVDSTRRTLCGRAGRGGGIQGDGPDGLAALEDLERLGRVYVLCLAE